MLMVMPTDDGCFRCSSVLEGIARVLTANDVVG
jgi:hypothetical protein